MSSAETREQILTKALEELKQKAGAVIQSVMDDLYCDYLPHIETDTDANINSRVAGVVQNLIAGKFERLENQMVRVSDSYDAGHYISLGEHSTVVKPLCDQMSDEIKGSRILQLEAEVARLNRELIEAYRRG